LAQVLIAEDTKGRVGMQAFPSVGGNSLGPENLPSLYTFATLFDGLTYVGLDGKAKLQLATSWT
jgi:hypothetical protein